MGFAKKIVIAVEMNNELYDVLKTVKKMNFLNEAEVNIVHISQTVSITVAFDGTPLVYPISEDRKAIRESVIETLKKVSKEFMPASFSGNVSYHCLFSDDPKRAFSEFVEEEKMDLVIVATKQKHGLFESSFAQYVNKHTKANVLMLKK